MERPGYILRFVDVVLILLFGFISISSIESTDIELPESTETKILAPDREEVIFVGVQQDGSFLVEDETRTIPGLRGLQAYLLQKRDSYEKGVPIKVRIRCSKTAPMQYLMRAASLCDELGLRKSIEVKIDQGD